MWSILPHRMVGLVHQYLQLKYLFINTLKDAPHCRVMVLARILQLVLFVTLYWRYEFETANQPGFEPNYANHWATLHGQSTFFKEIVLSSALKKIIPNLFFYCKQSFKPLLHPPIHQTFWKKTGQNQSCVI